RSSARSPCRCRRERPPLGPAPRERLAHSGLPIYSGLMGPIAAHPANVEALVAGSSSTPARRLPRLSVRGLSFLILFVALALGWFASQRSAERERRQHEQLLRYAEEGLRRARDELRDWKRGPRPDRARSFWEADLEGSNL